MACALSGAFNGSGSLPDYLLKELEKRESLIKDAEYLIKHLKKPNQDQ